jgi:hypothetical protein
MIWLRRIRARIWARRAAYAFVGSLKTADPRDRANCIQKVLEQALAMARLDLSVDEVVDRIVEQATPMLTRVTRVDECGLVVNPHTEPHELDRQVREILTPLIGERDYGPPRS